MPVRRVSPRATSGPTLALSSVPMTNPGEEVRRARLARGWSIAELATRSGVGHRTITRIEGGTGGDTKLAALQKFLQIGPYETYDVIGEGPPLHRATLTEILTEIRRRDEGKDHLLQRIRTGDVPAGILDEPGVIGGPRNDPPRESDGT